MIGCVERKASPEVKSQARRFVSKKFSASSVPGAPGRSSWPRSDSQPKEAAGSDGHKGATVSAGPGAEGEGLVHFLVALQPQLGNLAPDNLLCLHSSQAAPRRSPARNDIESSSR